MRMLLMPLDGLTEPDPLTDLPEKAKLNLFVSGLNISANFVRPKPLKP